MNSGTEGAARCRARVAGEATARPRARTRCHVCRRMSDKPEPRSSQSPAAEAAPPPRAVRGYRGPGLVGVRVDVARMQADSAPQPPSAMSPATSAEELSSSSPVSPETIQREGPRTKEQQRKDEAAAGTGEGGDKEGEAEASGGSRRWWQREPRGRMRSRGSKQ